MDKIVALSFLVGIFVALLIFWRAKKYLWDGRATNGFQRFVRRGFWLLAFLGATAWGIFALTGLVSSFVLPELFPSDYSRAVKVEGITSAEKLQSIATIVASSHKEVLDVAYVNAGGQPGFLVTVKSSATSNTNAAAQRKNGQEYANALATLLKLTATEVLPTEPAIQYIIVETVAKGDMQTYVADAAELKALPSNASDRAWLAKLQVPPSSQGPSAQSAPSSN